MVTVQKGAGAVVGGAVDAVGIGAGGAVGETVGLGSATGIKARAGDVGGGVVGTVDADGGNVVVDGTGAGGFLLASGFFEWLEDNATAATARTPMRRTDTVPTTSPLLDVVRCGVVDCPISSVTSTQPAPSHCRRPDHLTPSQKVWSFGFDPVEYQPGALSFATIKKTLDADSLKRTWRHKADTI